MHPLLQNVGGLTRLIPLDTHMTRLTNAWTYAGSMLQQPDLTAIRRGREALQDVAYELAHNQPVPEGVTSTEIRRRFCASTAVEAAVIIHAAAQSAKARAHCYCQIEKIWGGSC